jgi:hypothetical protein
MANIKIPDLAPRMGALSGDELIEVSLELEGFGQVSRRVTTKQVAETVVSASAAAAEAAAERAEAAEASAVAQASLAQASADAADASATTATEEADDAIAAAAAAASALAISIGLLTTDIATTRVPAELAAFTTIGYSTPGIGGAEFVEISGAVQPGEHTSLDGRRWGIAGNVVGPEQFGALGEGEGGNDDTAAVLDCLDFANVLATGVAANVFLVTRTVVLSRQYNLASLAAPLEIKCGVECQNDARFIIPADYADEAVRVGLDTATLLIQGAVIDVPEVSKPQTNDPLVAGSVGVRLLNLNKCAIRLSSTRYFETGVQFGGIGEGFVYNQVFLGETSYCQVALALMPGVDGWCNTNSYYGGKISQSPGYAGSPRISGWRHILIDGRSPATPIYDNTFYGLSMEGDVSEYVIEAHAASGNTWVAPYFESGAPQISVSVSGSTITSVAHGLTVEDQVCFVATALPTDMVDNAPYYVLSTPTADTFTVGFNLSGSAVSFGSSGTNVRSILQNRILFAQTGGDVCANNRLVNLQSPASTFLTTIQTGVALNNGAAGPQDEIVVRYGLEDFPIHRGFNDAGSNGVRAVWAAYADRDDPYANPTYWRCALSDKGVYYGLNGTVLGHTFNIAGAMQYRRPADTMDYALPSARRSEALIAITGLSCAAGATTTTTISLTGAETNGHVIVNPSGPLPDGLVIAYARVSATDTVSLGFTNITGSPISLTTSLSVIMFRRFY